jgi:subtilisin family serine protease
LNAIQPFLNKIRPWNAASPRLSARLSTSKKNIRIAVLDSGVYCSDPMIRGATARIIDRRNWVGGLDDDDTYGHGTHVARLLLATAPAADIYIGKICNGKVMNDEYMPGIAKVSFPYILRPKAQFRP